MRALALQPDGKIVVAGRFINSSGNPSSGIARVNPDGSLDAGFASDLYITTDTAVTDIDLQRDGKIILTGSLPCNPCGSVDRLSRRMA